MNPLRALIVDRIRTAGPISVAEYMRLALYHPSYGYYARASRRTGRAGDFITSVDIGPLFGQLLAEQFAEMWKIFHETQSRIPSPESLSFDLVEAGAGSARLAHDILDLAARKYPEFYREVRLHLVDVAPTARAAQQETLGSHFSKLVSSSASLPDAVNGVIFANELLDALPVHAVVMRDEGLREVFVALEGDEFVEREGWPSTPELTRYLARAGVRLQEGWRAEVNLEASAWMQQAARALRRGFLVVIDYGHEAAELYSAAHSAGTLTAFRQHTSSDRVALLNDPGDQDLTAHVDLTTVTRQAEAEGLVTLGKLDQTYFLIGLGLAEMLEDGEESGVPSSGGACEKDHRPLSDLKKRLALKTLVVPGGLGSTHKVLIFGKDVGAPKLRGLSYRVRMT